MKNLIAVLCFLVALNFIMDFSQNKQIKEQIKYIETIQDYIIREQKEKIERVVTFH